MKKYCSASFLFILIGLFFFSHSVSAFSAESTNYGEYKDEDYTYYYLDIVPDEPGDFFEDGEQGNGFWDWLTSTMEAAGDQITIIFNWFANLGLQFNIMLTNFMLWAVDFAYDFEFVNIIINEISDVMRNISGISITGNFQTSGVFGNLAIFVTVLAIAYAVFILLFKKSMFKSLGTILQTALCLTLAILLFTNYAPFLKGINQVTTELSALILSGESISDNEEEYHDPTQPVPQDDEAPTGLSEDTLKTQMQDNLWGMFVDRPYLYMMYGETELIEDIDEAGDDILTKERAGSLLRERPNSDERLAILQDEFEAKGNTAITYSNVTNRIAFTPIYLGINGLMGFFVWGLAFALIAVQFWFLLIALFAPFALLLGAIPGMFNVLKKYSIELVIPLAVKILLSFGALMVFAMSDVLFQLNFRLDETVGQGSPLAYYLAAGIANLVLFALIFILRKRISSIFVKSNSFISDVRDGAGQVSDPLKKGIQNTATVTGAAVGGATGGLQGAALGAQAGNLIGKSTTGDVSGSDYAAMAGSIGRHQMYSQMADGKQDDKKSNGVKLKKQNQQGEDFIGKDNFTDNKEDLCPKCGQNPCVCNKNSTDKNDKDEKCPTCGQNPCACDDPKEEVIDSNDQQTKLADNLSYFQLEDMPDDNGLEYENMDEMTEQDNTLYTNTEDMPLLEQEENYSANMEDSIPPENNTTLTHLENMPRDEERENLQDMKNESDPDDFDNNYKRNYHEMENVPENERYHYSDLENFSNESSKSKNEDNHNIDFTTEEKSLGKEQYSSGNDCNTGI